ncbi:GlsB/YeaQ/YmgE family stress response membrane protein [Sneathiella sp.]|uniref:GlsB/YeaQ/YmgE family stress response membrane protein n=1 Tax=Sneathiella sp. TaxID=1964365 RepID=UPI00261FBE23|nr:GlsB/YeaQ/YmgE family stress response membrane protein [Sneathiella sp.]MDF2368249.1 GlsB/YeaQ/YmgE family stress response membrane protein [Sneathiella sp.]
MGVESLLIFLLIGAVAGWLAGLIIKGFGFGLIGNIVVGIIGAFIAGFVLPKIGIDIGGGILAAIIHATIGAVVFLFIIKLIKSRG